VSDGRRATGCGVNVGDVYRIAERALSNHEGERAELNIIRLLAFRAGSDFRSNCERLPDD
jgi:hypothetical protein